MIKIYIEEAEDLLRESPTYKEILEHRKECPKWGKDFCLECFGGGLTKFLNSVRKELILKEKSNHNGFSYPFKDKSIGLHDGVHRPNYKKENKNDK